MSTSHLISIAGIAMALLAGSAHHQGSANARAEEPQRPDVSGNYATVNGLRMYYETRGEGEPLVLLHGAFGLAMDLPALAKNRRVIAVELQGHGHTADIDRPLSVEQMADDTAALLHELKIERADFFGYSMGGVVALGVAIRHPSLVRKLAINGSYFGSVEAAFEPESFKQFRNLPADSRDQCSKPRMTGSHPTRRNGPPWSPRSRRRAWSSRALPGTISKRSRRLS